jgi:hypothetical protein
VPGTLEKIPVRVVLAGADAAGAEMGEVPEMLLS